MKIRKFLESNTKDTLYKEVDDVSYEDAYVNSGNILVNISDEEKEMKFLEIPNSEISIIKNFLFGNYLTFEYKEIDNDTRVNHISVEVNDDRGFDITKVDDEYFIVEETYTYTINIFICDSIEGLKECLINEFKVIPLNPNSKEYLVRSIKDKLNYLEIDILKKINSLCQ